MKVYLGPKASPKTGGMFRVIDSLYTHLPIEIVDTIAEADVVHQHIAFYQNIPVNKPLVLSSHGLLWDEHEWHGHAWKTNASCVRSMLAADVVTAPSRFVANAIARNTLLSPVVVHHGIDTELWVPETSQGYVLWNKSRIDPANDARVVNRLAALAPRETFVTTFGDEAANVNIMGTTTLDEMHTLVAQAGVYLDTPKESGGPCFGVLEAMACGVPVLSWDYGGTAEVIRHQETGYLARVGDYDDLLAGLKYCLSNKGRLGAAARQDVIDHYTVQQSMVEYVEAYQLAIDKHKYATKVSIVVPCYNLGKFLPACLDSIRQQDFQDWEAIIVDDASEDNSASVGQHYARLDKRIKYIRNATNLHVADSRNAGIRASQGQYIVPLDADDRLEEGALAAMVDALEADRNIHIVSGRLRLYAEDKLDIGYPGQWPIDDISFELQIAGYNRLPYCAMYRRQVWENTGGYRRRIRNGVEDADFWTRAFSFGYRPYLLNNSILKYTLRNNSLRTANTEGTLAWLPWFPWSYRPELTPLGATGKGPYTIAANDKPVVSVVVPVGPEHTLHMQACADSVMAQTFPSWELILVNDTGKLWSEEDLRGLSFATIINKNSNTGVADARNAGIHAAKADKIVFLDVDDVLQPRALELLVKAHALVGGWIYGDWYYKLPNGLIQHETAADFSVAGLKDKMLGPITGLFEKEHLELIGGFDLAAPGWEDWDMQLSLLGRGICGTRLAYPLIFYNMTYGFRREENFSKKKDLLQYIIDKHTNLYGDAIVACKTCGGKSTVVVKANTPPPANAVVNTDGMVLMKYTGPQSQTRTFASKKRRGVRYRINNQKPFPVFAEDVDEFLAIKFFEVVEHPAVTEEQEVSTAILKTDTVPVKNTLQHLDVDAKVRDLLLARFTSIEDVSRADDATLLAIRGIGPARLTEIRAAINDLN